MDHPSVSAPSISALLARKAALFLAFLLGEDFATRSAIL
jgi:hypothetical protein